VSAERGAQEARLAIVRRETAATAWFAYLDALAAEEEARIAVCPKGGSEDDATLLTMFVLPIVDAVLGEERVEKKAAPAVHASPTGQGT